MRESAEGKADGTVRQELGCREWTEETLAARRKEDPEKVEMACRLRRETTVTLEWIAKRLQMGTKTHLAHLLYWQGRATEKHDTID